MYYILHLSHLIVIVEMLPSENDATPPAASERPKIYNDQSVCANLFKREWYQ